MIKLWKNLIMNILVAVLILALFIFVMMGLVSFRKWVVKVPNIEENRVQPQIGTGIMIIAPATQSHETKDACDVCALASTTSGSILKKCVNACK